MQLPRLSRRWWIAGAIALSGVLLICLALLVIYPRVGASKIRQKIGAKVTSLLGRDVRFGEIDVSIGRAVIRDLDIRGPNDGDTPLVHIDRIEVEFDGWKSLVGSVELGDAVVEGVFVTLRRGPDGRDNVSDVIERIRADRAKPRAAGGGRSELPTSIKLTRAKLLADDAVTGATALVGDGEVSWRPGELIAQARQVTATTIGAPKAAAAKIEIVKRTGQPPSIAIESGELALWPKLALTGIGGKVVAHPDKPDHFVIELAGGYGGVPGNLWTAQGALDARALTASIDLEAAKFQLERLAPILEKSPVVDYASTSIDTRIHVDLGRDGGKFAGEFHLYGLNVGHPMIADKEVHDLDLSGKIAGSFDRAQRKLELTQGDFVARDLPFSLTGSVARPLAVTAAPTTTPLVEDDDDKPGVVVPVPLHGPGGIQALKLRIVIPPNKCQRVLDAIPVEMAPYMTGYKLKGTFETDLVVEIDWANLDATKLGGKVGINGCKVLDEPKESVKRLEEEFEHYVEVEEDQWISFVVGPTNPDFVPIAEISPYLIKSIMTTEDAAFFRHRGYIPSEFRSALIKDLKAGKFKYGASSITMQMVKNVLLYREKTLLRKLQELFLTWHVEKTLTKDRILEIYFNVIEYGPNLYGIGPATRHFFGKAPRELNPVEAAFFSSILPGPKPRYKQYCAGTLTKWTSAKINRILALMHKREHITQLEYDQALATPLLFVKDGTETEEECLKRTKKAIKNARPTNPLKR